MAKLPFDVLPGLGGWLWLRYSGRIVCAASHVHCCGSDSDDHRGLGMLGGRISNGSSGMILEMLDTEVHYIEYNDSRQRGLSKLG